MTGLPGSNPGVSTIEFIKKEGSGMDSEIMKKLCEIEELLKGIDSKLGGGSQDRRPQGSWGKGPTDIYGNPVPYCGMPYRGIDVCHVDE